MVLEYILANECENTDAWYTCLHCGKCGRRFENGIMVDDGGTTIYEDEEGETE